MAEKTVPTLTQQTEQRNEPTPTRSEETFVAPPVDIYEDDQGLVVLADLPGVAPDALDIRVERGVLTIQGRAQHTTGGEGVYREFELAGFYRQFQLPDEIDSTKIDAGLKDGVLTVHLPRAEPAQPRRIQVRAT